MKEAIRRSGYLLGQRVFPVLEQNGYYVETNPVYADSITGKAREYDFSAICAVRVFREEYDFLFTHLIGECVNNTHPLVFFKSESPIEFMFHEELKAAGIPLYFVKKRAEDERSSFRDHLKLGEFHHYCKSAFSTQYCSFRLKTGKDAQWMAWHDEEHHGVFNSLVEATKFTVNGYFSAWEPPKENEDEPVNLNLFYPVLILNRDLFECSKSERRLVLRRKEHIQFRKSVISDGEQETYQIDVILEKFLPKYLAMLEREQCSLRDRMRRRKKQVREAIAYIVSKAKNELAEGKISKYKQALEP